MYKIEFGGEAVYEGDNKAIAQMIATAFAHAYSVSGWGQVSLKLSIRFGGGMKAFSGYLGRDAIAVVNDFFRHY